MTDFEWYDQKELKTILMFNSLLFFYFALDNS